MRILVGGNESDTANKVTSLLRQSGLAVDRVDQVGDLLSLPKRQAFDLILVYFGQGQKRTTDLFRALRRQGCTTPVLGVSLGSDLSERIEALNSGADDCVPASVPPEELLARMRALLRRPPVLIGPTYSIGDLTLDASIVLVTCRGNPVTMPRREIALLETLMRAGSSQVSRERLEHALFSFDDAVTPNALEAAISRLRRRLKSVGSNVTVVANRGFGYMLTPVQSRPTSSLRKAEPSHPADALAIV